MSILGNIIPKELLGLCEVISNWFTNSGLKEKMEETGTTGVHYFKTTINGKDAIVAIGVSYISEEQASQIDKLAASTFTEANNGAD